MNAEATFTLAELTQAADLVHELIEPTPFYAWPKLHARTGCEVRVKHENHTPTGAFKVRGGLVYMHRLRRQARGTDSDHIPSSWQLSGSEFGDRNVRGAGR